MFTILGLEFTTELPLFFPFATMILSFMVVGLWAESCIPFLSGWTGERRRFINMMEGGSLSPNSIKRLNILTLKVRLGQLFLIVALASSLNWEYRWHSSDSFKGPPPDWVVLNSATDEFSLVEQATNDLHAKVVLRNNRTGVIHELLYMGANCPGLTRITPDLKFPIAYEERKYKSGELQTMFFDVRRALCVGG